MICLELVVSSLIDLVDWMFSAVFDFLCHQFSVSSIQRLFYGTCLFPFRSYAHMYKWHIIPSQESPYLLWCLNLWNDCCNYLKGFLHCHSSQFWFFTRFSILEYQSQIKVFLLKSVVLIYIFLIEKSTVSTSPKMLENKTAS